MPAYHSSFYQLSSVYSCPFRPIVEYVRLGRIGPDLALNSHMPSPVALFAEMVEVVGDEIKKRGELEVDPSPRRDSGQVN